MSSTFIVMYLRKIFILLLTCVAFFSCQNQTAETGNRAVFHYNEPNPITSLDPAFSKSQNNNWVNNQLHKGLVQLNDALEVVPAIAKSWTVNEAGTQITFHLRDDVLFHKNACFTNEANRKVTSEDVAYSLGRILDPEVKSPGSWIFRNRLADVPFETPDEQTFILNLAKPFRPIMGILTMQYCSVVPKEAVEQYGKAWRTQTVGVGPFQFVKWVENQVVILERNPEYFEQDASGKKLPYLDGVRVSFITDRNAAFIRFKQKKLDLISGLESAYVDELITKDGQLQSSWNNEITFNKVPFLNSEYLGIRMKNTIPALRSKKVRQALNYSLDREKMLRSLRNNIGVPATGGFIPKGLPAFNVKKTPGFKYDLGKARKLLAEAGFPDGKGLETITLYVNKDYLDLCNFITRQWEEIGVKVKVEMVETATLRSMMSGEKAPFYRASWIADYPDGESFLTMYYGKNPAPPNYTRFSNSKFDQLYERGLTEHDDEKRIAMYHEMENILLDEAPVVFLFYDETARFYWNNISGFGSNALNILDLKKVKKSN